MARALPPRGFEEEDTQKRLQWLEDKTGVRLDDVKPDGPTDYQGIIENHVGSVNMPMAVAGPLVLSGSYAQGEYYVPLCTLEATLSMSMSRGLYLTSLSGGIKTRHLKQELSRSPVFIFDDIEEARLIIESIIEMLIDIRDDFLPRMTTPRRKLTRITQK